MSNKPFIETPLDIYESPSELPDFAEDGTRAFVMSEQKIFQCWHNIWTRHGPSAAFTESLIIKIRTSLRIDEVKFLYDSIDIIKTLLEQRILNEE